MANNRETRGLGERTFSHKAEVQQIVPSSGWTEDSDTHYLLLRLPDFKTEEVKLDVDKYGRITVSGERLQTAPGGDKFKIFMFEQTFRLPHNSDVDQILGKMEGDMLRITVPKRPLEDENVHHVNEEISYKQETVDNIDENKHSGGGDGDGDGGGGDCNADGGVGGGGSCRLEKRQKNNSQIDCFPRQMVVVVMAVLVAILAYGMYGHA